MGTQDAKNVFHYFNAMNQIPRASGKEKAVSDWIAGWAGELGLEVKQDPFNNLVIRKPAAAGYEGADPVILQAHMDMVCEKTSQSVHDFDKDPILLKQEGDWLVSACGTSIGADDGIGVASAMAVLADTSLKHPPLEVIFTTEEETTFAGAEGISPDLFCGRRMINLDHAVDTQVVAGSCGGKGVSFVLPLEWEEEVPRDCHAYRIWIGGMEGGHSGEDIHRGRGNAIQLLTRVLDDPRIALASADAGTNRLAIPREAEAVVLVRDEEGFSRRLEVMKEAFRKEYSITAPELELTMERVEKARPLKPESLQKVLMILKLFPDGISNMCGGFEGIVESSDNLGILRLADGKLSITGEIRGLYGTTVDWIGEKISALGAATGGTVEFFGAYDAWEYQKDSPLREIAKDTYRKLFHEEMEELILHAGLECSAFITKAPGMDMISIGPNCDFFHSPNERVSISSVQKMYEFLLRLLEELKG